jgi:hypothetical protein
VDAAWVSEVQRWQGRPPRTGGLPRRGTDRLEDRTAWVLIVVALFLLILSVLAGLRAEADAVTRARAEDHERARVEAVVLHDAAAPDYQTDGGSVDWVSVQYTDGKGQVHEADVKPAAQSPAGTVMQLWVDRAGRLAPPPSRPLDAVVSGLAVGLGVAATGWLLLVLLWAAVRRVVDAQNAVAWAREWETVEPEWSGRRR